MHLSAVRGYLHKTFIKAILLDLFRGILDANFDLCKHSLQIFCARKYKFFFSMCKIKNARKSTRRCASKTVKTVETVETAEIVQGVSKKRYFLDFIRVSVPFFRDTLSVLKI